MTPKQSISNKQNSQSKQKYQKKHDNKKKAFGLLLAVGIYVGLIYFVLAKSTGAALDYSPYWQYRVVIYQGWLTTIGVSLIALLLSLLIGIGLYFMEQSHVYVLKYLAMIHKDIIFGTPLLVIAIVGYYYIGNAFGLDSKFWIGAFTLALYIGAYISDIYKGAVQSIHPNQWQTAKMFGFSKLQTYRYVIFPQVFRQILPPLTGQFALTIKGSALLSYMATDEFLNAVKTVQAATFAYSEGFIIVSIGYLVLTVPLIHLIKFLEEKLNLEGSHESMY